MAKGFKHGGCGGGTSLNFEVVGNPQPANPKENTIWVNTDVPIGAWYFDAMQPENLNEGDVWFSVGTSRPVEFNALKKNGIAVYPASAKQYVGGAWVAKDAQIYQGGEWAYVATYLLRGADLCEKITGGWTAEAKGYNANVNSPEKPTVTIGSNSITVALTRSNWASGIYYANNKIDLTEKSTLFITGVADSNASPDGSNSVTIWSTIGTYVSDNKVAAVYVPTTKGTVTIDVSELSGEYVIGVELLSNGTTAASVTLEEIVAK